MTIVFDLSLLKELASSYTLGLLAAVWLLYRENGRLRRQNEDLYEKLIRYLELKNAEDRAELTRPYPGPSAGPPN